MISAFNISTNASKTSNVGEYNITVSGGEAKNYEVTTYIGGKFSITKAPLTITANNATKVYGEVNPSFKFACSPKNFQQFLTEEKANSSSPDSLI